MAIKQENKEKMTDNDTFWRDEFIKELEKSLNKKRKKNEKRSSATENLD